MSPTKKKRVSASKKSTKRKRAAARVRRAKRPASAAAAAQDETDRFSGLTARDVMVRDVLKVAPGTSVDEVSSLFQLHNINGCPVVDDEGRLIGIVTEDDLVFGRMGATDEEMAAQSAPKGSGLHKARVTHFVAEIMTPNPIAANEDTPVEELCRLMWRLKIHRIPIVRDRKVTGIVSSLDVCRLLAEGSANLVPRNR